MHNLPAVDNLSPSKMTILEGLVRAHPQGHDMVSYTGFRTPRHLFVLCRVLFVTLDNDVRGSKSVCYIIVITTSEVTTQIPSLYLVMQSFEFKTWNCIFFVVEVVTSMANVITLSLWQMVLIDGHQLTLICIGCRQDHAVVLPHLLHFRRYLINEPPNLFHLIHAHTVFSISFKYTNTYSILQ